MKPSQPTNPAVKLPWAKLGMDLALDRLSSVIVFTKSQIPAEIEMLGSKGAHSRLWAYCVFGKANDQQQPIIEV